MPIVPRAVTAFVVAAGTSVFMHLRPDADSKSRRPWRPHVLDRLRPTAGGPGARLFGGGASAAKTGPADVQREGSQLREGPFAAAPRRVPVRPNRIVVVGLRPRDALARPIEDEDASPVAPEEPRELWRDASVLLLVVAFIIVILGSFLRPSNAGGVLSETSEPASAIPGPTESPGGGVVTPGAVTLPSATPDATTTPLSTPGPTPSPAAAVTPAPTPRVTPRPTPRPTPRKTPKPTPAPTRPPATPTPTPTPTPSPTPTPTPAP